MLVWSQVFIEMNAFIRIKNEEPTHAIQYSYSEQIKINPCPS